MKPETQTCLLSILIGLVFMIGAVLCGAGQAAAAGETAVVAGSSVNVRNGPGTNYGVIAQAYQGEKFTVLGQSTDWYNVALSSGGQGWVAGWLVAIQQPQQVAVLSGNGINVRGGPGTTYGVITQGGLGDRFPVLEKSGDWVKVQLSSGTGWVAGWLVSLETAQPGVSQPAAPAPSTAGGSKVAVVSGSLVNVRSGPGTSNAIVGTAAQGNSLPVLSQSGDWVQVSLPSGGTGWVAGWLVALNDAPPQPDVSQPSAGGSKVAVVSGSLVNVRSGPGTSNAIVGTAAQGNSLPVLSQSGDWVQVSLPSGGTGWVAGWLVALNDAAPAQPAQPGYNEVSRGDWSASTARQSGQVLSLNVEKNDSDETIFTLKTDTPVSYDMFYLSNPDRLVVDIEGVSPGSLPLVKEMSTSKTVSRVRIGYFQKNPDVTRMVFELKSGVMCEVSLSSNKMTLTVDTFIPDLSGASDNRVIVLDPGHGGPDPGAIGPGGTREETLTLDIAKRVSRLLEAQGAEVIMTRSTDTDVSLSERTNIANRNDADIFVSIHINAHNDPTIGGTSTYIYSGGITTGEAARRQESNMLARFIQTEMVKSLGLRDIGIKEANFAVLRTSSMPAVLLEVAFISNSAEEKLLKTDTFKNKAAEAIARGINTYFSQRR